MKKLSHMTKNECIRVFADPDHIAECREVVQESASRVTSISEKLSLIANEVRFTLLMILSDSGKQCVCDLSDILEMKVPAISQHLRKLKDGGLISNERVGATVFYQINESTMPLVQPLFEMVKQQKVSAK